MKQSPWGKVDHSVKVCRGVTSVSTPSHGGFLISIGVAEKKLSPAARKYGMKWGGYLAFEEDIDANIIFLEIPESRSVLLNPELCTEESLIKNLSAWSADYLLERGITPDQEAYKKYLERNLDDEMRTSKHPDLIVSALSMSDRVVKVYTADGRSHFVTSESYQRREGLNLLSKCEILSGYVQTTNLHF